jgi:thymidylate synthase (FAD)
MSATRKSKDDTPRPETGAQTPKGGRKRRLLNEAQEAEVRELRETRVATRRATVPALEEILYEPLPVLDHGFVRVVDYMGDDAAIVQAARVSYGKGTKQARGDAALIDYLLRHRHTTPFEMCEIKFHVKLPIFVARQWIRHRTANVNEYSARYSVLDKEFYIPAPEHLAAQSQANRQGRGEVLEGAQAARVLEILREDAAQTYAHYEEMLNQREDGSIIDEGQPGLARELARMNLPLNIYTQWYWKCDLHNLLHFLSLRADPHAQFEIRAYADAMLETVKRWVPITYESFAKNAMDGVRLSGPALKIVRRLLAGEAVVQEESGLSKREWSELMTALGREN